MLFFSSAPTKRYATTMIEYTIYATVLPLEHILLNIKWLVLQIHAIILINLCRCSFCSVQRRQYQFTVYGLISIRRVMKSMDYLSKVISSKVAQSSLWIQSTKYVTQLCYARCPCNYIWMAFYTTVFWYFVLFMLAVAFNLNSLVWSLLHQCCATYACIALYYYYYYYSETV